MEYEKDNVCREEKGGEATDKKKDPEKKPGMLKKVINKIAVPLVAGIIAVGGAACSTEVKSVYPTCDCYEGDSEITSDMENEADVENDVDEDSELDMPADVPEETDVEDVTEEDVEEEDTSVDAEEEDVVEEDAPVDVEEEDVSSDVLGEDVSEEDVSVDDVEVEDVVEEDTMGDVPADVSEEDVMEEDVSGEDVAEDTTTDVSGEDVSGDVVEEDVVSDTEGDTIADVEGDVMTECDPVDDVRVLILPVGTIELVGNIGVRYNGLNGVEASYDILCGDVVVKSDVRVPVSGVEVVDLSSEYGFRVELRVSKAGTTDCYMRVAVDAI